MPHLAVPERSGKPCTLAIGRRLGSFAIAAAAARLSLVRPIDPSLQGRNLGKFILYKRELTGQWCRQAFEHALEKCMRPSRRQPDELRPVSLERGVVKYAEGSCFVKFGDTHVLVTATLEDRLPPWLKGQARGWITAEYGMLPRATLERTRREASTGKQNGRTVEIQRLIGRSLRSVIDLKALGERQITLDCDVIQADGGTRTASITGAWIALNDCLGWMRERQMIESEILRDHVAAISCGVCSGTAVLDLDYAEDSQADTDANFVLTGSGNIVEVQATAEKTPFSEAQFSALLALARKGVAKLVDLQKMAVL
jgi:ribonuclease PH